MTFEPTHRVLFWYFSSSTSCEVVVNANEPAFLKIHNLSGEQINVDLTDVIPLSALMSRGACEIYELSTGTHDIKFTEKNGSGSKR